mmetsp:Transcript_18718/g.48759  ORF Transcript_18718/g.48759 Transcript_18718/m.48759 type:complete len:126 (+) Transcript_18718:100-477(+)|eukprot:CAMPEP_0182925302 /NCGR_PEP_ID=MMETSP0105_2-20130417/9168_1 /TAXON_ID=81532 ORGANISM="Acanthoeca-like sp., Strain 10tr" /NCGR_SAMPLE_ID=MMETSP0105_2 /ASSEMBLY_ACC=CAM_ASM_000205 /LENGTH=125 /DNA_ID=CAMNT_0025063145 /DNA_START=62 /DNA_END=439 /DNA_ORIENTATION=-
MAKTKATTVSATATKAAKAAIAAKAAPAKKSARVRRGPQRFIPGGSADVPQEVEDMVHTIATEAVRSAPLPMTSDAVTALRTALLPAMTAFVDAARASAATRGSDEITDKDFEAVLEYYLKRKAE